MKEITKLIRMHVIEQFAERDNAFDKIVAETVEQMKRYKDGSCYKCGGTVMTKNNRGIWSDFICNNCGADIYTDAPWEYYYGKIIKKISELAGI